MLSGRAGSAPACSSTANTDSWPYSAARCNAVCPCVPSGPFVVELLVLSGVPRECVEVTVRGFGKEGLCRLMFGRDRLVSWARSRVNQNRGPWSSD